MNTKNPPTRRVFALRCFPLREPIHPFPVDLKYRTLNSTFPSHDQHGQETNNITNIHSYKKLHFFLLTLSVSTLKCRLLTGPVRPANAVQNFATLTVYLTPNIMSDVPKLAVKIEPLGDRVVIMPLEAEEVTASGIVIPDTASKEKPSEGIVIAIGKGGVGKDCADPSAFLKVGDKVLFGKYAGDDVKLKSAEGKDLEVKVLHLDSVLGKVV